MSFRANRQGFFEDEQIRGSRGGGGKLPNFSHSSSSSSSSPTSSSSHHITHLPPTYPQHHLPHHHHQHFWFDANQDDNSTTSNTRRFFTEEEGAGRSAATTHIESFVMDSSPLNNNGDDRPGNYDDTAAETDDTHQVRRPGDGDSTTDAHDSGGGNGLVMEREHMFDKVVTPSDVGKLNRLVIPKQHAEKYFPLDSSTSDKGLLLNFEDRNGKPWRFRYSYWNSSQSYVMTKGWSRFVKEKKLDAGDIVSFQRGVGDLAKDRLFIDWKRRPEAQPEHLMMSMNHTSLPHHYLSFHHRSSVHHPWNHPLLQGQGASMPLREQYSHGLLRPSFTASYGYGYGGGHNYGYNNMVSPCPPPPPGSVIYLRSGVGVGPQEFGMVQRQSGSGVEPMVFESVPVVHGKAAAAPKRLRLFGVNMECPISDSDECDMLSSSSITPIMPNSNSNSIMPPPPVLSHNIPSSSSSPHDINNNFIPSSLQLRPYNDAPLPAMASELLNKGKAPASMSFDLDI